MSESAAVALVGALDTKGDEYTFVRTRLEARGLRCVTVDIGVLGSPRSTADLDRTAVAAAAGCSIDDLVREADRNAAMIAMAAGAARIVGQLSADGHLSGVFAMGGSNAAFVMGVVAAALPIGVPKMLVSTAVAGDTASYVGTSDLTMMYPVEDVAGLNSVSAPLLARAADALAGMVEGAPVSFRGVAAESVALTMFGITTPGVTAARDAVERGAREAHVFHANGRGGRTLEALLRSGAFDAVLDLTTTELADELLGGICSAGPDRLTAAGRRGIRQIVSTGALDVVNFGPINTVPGRFRGRRLHAHNPTVTLMRVEPDESAEIGKILARKLNAATGPVEVHVPMVGFSQLSVPGGPFHHPESDEALLSALRQHLDARIELRTHDVDINSPAFAAAVAARLDAPMHTVRKEAP
jgi:uncharacterized protein (UPF0261 family)